jgi:hypothetical protein
MKIGSEVLTAVSMKMAVFWVAASARTSETLVNFYQTTRRYNPEDSHLRVKQTYDGKSVRLFRLRARSRNKERERAYCVEVVVKLFLCLSIRP